MLRPIMIVGVGGSGGKTLRAMRQTLLRRLRQKGWTKDRLPEGWQMLWVDSVSQQDEDAFESPLLPNDQYAGLVSPGLRYSDLRTSLEQSVPKNQRLDALAGWTPDTVPISVAAGAGQARAIGRVISAAQLDTLKDRLDSSYRRLSGASVTSELAEVSRLLGQADGAALTEPLALVISSVAGGSGSGMFLDVVETLKSVAPAFTEPGVIMTVLYTPDVFESVKGAGDQIPPNTLAAVMEACSGVFAAGLTHASDGLLTSQGVVSRSRHGFGSKANFLVGARNNRITLGSQEEIYHAVGDSLTSVIADDNVQQTLRAFTITNVFLNSGLPLNVLDTSGLTDSGNDDESMPFSALGMARVTLGTDRLTEYVTQLVTRDIVESLLWPEYDPAYRQDGQRIPSQERIDERVHERWRSLDGKRGFLIESGLNERQSADDIIDQLVEPAMSARIGQWAQGVVTTASQGVDSKGLPPSDWVHRLHSQFTNRLAALRSSESDIRYGLAQRWTSATHRRLTELIASEAASSGFTVTTELLERLISEMEHVSGELKNESASTRGQVELVHGELNRVLNDAGAARIGSDESHLTERAKKVLQVGAGLAVDADRKEFAAILVQDLTNGMLEPLLDAVRTSRARLIDNISADRVDGRANPWPLLPQYDKPVPSQMSPGTTERTLLKVTDFPDVVAREVKSCLRDAERGNWRQVLRMRAALGRSLDLDDPVGESILTHVARWSSQDPRANESGIAGAKGSYRLPQSVADVGAVVGRYLADAKSAAGITRFLGQGLSEYVESGTAQQQVDRQNDLISALTDAVQVAAPFVQINPAVKAALHPNVSDQLQLVVTTIPFPTGDPLHDRIKNVLVDANLWSDTQSPGWFKTDQTPEITVFTMTGKAMLPMVFDNVMRPVSESWARNSNAVATRHAFWSKRRARPLAEAIPAGPETIAAMMRGWFLAGLLNQRRIQDEVPSGWRVSVWDPDIRQMADFPFPLLSDRPISRDDIPAALMQSLGIAMIRVNAQGDLQPLRAYRRLMGLGDRASAARLLGTWVTSGTVADPGAPVPLLEVAGPSGEVGSPEARRAAVAETLDITKATYAREFAAAEDRDDPYSTPIIWELRDYVRGALNELTDALHAAQSDSRSL